MGIPLTSLEPRLQVSLHFILLLFLKFITNVLLELHINRENETQNVRVDSFAFYKTYSFIKLLEI